MSQEDNNKEVDERIGRINNEILRKEKQLSPENNTTTPNGDKEKDSLTTPSQSNESSNDEKKKQWATEPKKKF